MQRLSRIQKEVDKLKPKYEKVDVTIGEWNDESEGEIETTKRLINGEIVIDIE